MKCEAIGCIENAEYSRNVTVANCFGVEIQLCQKHYLMFDPMLEHRTQDEIKRQLDSAVMAPTMLD